MNSHIGLIGLAVMGQNLARNIANNFKISVYNRTSETTDEFITQYGCDKLVGFHNLKDFINSLSSPRKVCIMVKAGEPVDMVIHQILEFLDDGDIIIDLGNSYYKDTIRREEELRKYNIRYLGCGISGGEEGALKGPSIMPGGDKSAYESMELIFKNISASDFSSGDCVSYMGKNGAGHYVKMVHNGIEYGVMQMMAEAYDMLKNIYNLQPPQIANIFDKFNKGKLKSYLFEISVPILRKKDDLKDGYLIDKVLDTAEQKGTGRWTAIESLERGIGLSVITESVFARVYSSFKQQRVDISSLYKKERLKEPFDLDEFIVKLENTLYLGMIISYAQGFLLLQKAADDENWDLDFCEISRIWQGGCIIRADLLKFLQKSFNKYDEINLLKIPYITEEIQKTLHDFREIISTSTLLGIPTLALSSALNGFEIMSTKDSSANFIQALRDSFGAHTFKRKDKKGIFHANW